MDKKTWRVILLPFLLLLSACNPDDITVARRNPNFCQVVSDYLPIYLSMSDTPLTRKQIGRLNILHACKCLPKNKQPQVCNTQ